MGSAGTLGAAVLGLASEVMGLLIGDGWPVQNDLAAGSAYITSKKMWMKSSGREDGVNANGA